MSDRNRRLRLALGTSFLSKALGAIVQVISLPILLGALGNDRLAAYLALTAVVAWVAPLGLGVLPALTRQLAMAAARDDKPLQSALFGAGFWFVLIVGLLITVSSLLFATYGDVRALIGVFPTVSGIELRVGLALAMVLTGAFFFGNTSVAVRAGFQEYHISNTLSVIANVATIVLLLLLQGRDVAIGHFVTVVYAPLTVLVLFDLVRVLRAHPYLTPPKFPRPEELKHGELANLFHTSGSTWIAQIHGFLVAHASVVVVAHLFLANETSAFGAMMRVVLLVNAVVGLYVWPLIPAVTDAFTRGELGWARKSFQRSLALTLAAAGGAALVVAIAGKLLFRLWLGAGVEIDTPMLLGFAMFILGFNTTFFGFNLCLSVGETRLLALGYVAEIAAVVVVALLLTPVFGAAAIALALGVASLALNSWLLPWRAWRRIQSRMAATEAH